MSWISKNLSDRANIIRSGQSITMDKIKTLMGSSDNDLGDLGILLKGSSTGTAMGDFRSPYDVTIYFLNAQSAFDVKSNWIYTINNSTYTKYVGPTQSFGEQQNIDTSTVISSGAGAFSAGFQKAIDDGGANGDNIMESDNVDLEISYWNGTGWTVLDTFTNYQTDLKNAFISEKYDIYLISLL